MKLLRILEITGKAALAGSEFTPIGPAVSKGRKIAAAILGETAEVPAAQAPTTVREAAIGMVTANLAAFLARNRDASVADVLTEATDGVEAWLLAESAKIGSKD